MMLHRGQEQIDAFFASRSSYWRDIYGDDGVQAAIYRDRQATALAWIDQLALATGSRALDVGCGAGFLTVALAERGFRADAVDPVPAMVEQTRQHARAFADRVAPSLGDACALPFPDQAFDLVVALGVIPWLAQPDRAIQEMARVARPGGSILVTADNVLRLNHLLDPYLHPALRPVKRQLKRVLHRRGIDVGSSDAALATFHAAKAVDAMLAAAGLAKARSCTLGFGPFTFFARPIIPERHATAAHQRLQRLADRGVPGLRATGAHYLVLAHKREGGAAPRTTPAAIERDERTGWPFGEQEGRS